MSQAVKADYMAAATICGLFEPRSVQHLVQGLPEHTIVLGSGPACSIWEYEIEIGPWAPTFPCCQNRQECVDDGYEATRRSRLRLAVVTSSHVYRSALQVDICPTKPRQLSSSQPRERRCRVENMRDLGVGVLDPDEAPGRGKEASNFVLREPWRIVLVVWVRRGAPGPRARAQASRATRPS